MKALELHLVAAHLEGLEETIIARLIDRAQFKVNAAAYEAGKSGFEGADGESLFALRLHHHEEMDARFGRFCVPEERPFTSSLPSPRRTVTLPPTGLAIDDYDLVNVTADIKQAYLAMLPRLCRPGDDGQYGSSVEHDVHALQAISRRVHYGALYVAESKYRSQPALFNELIHRRDSTALTQQLTRPQVEEEILARVRQKVGQLQAGVNGEIRTVIDPAVVLAFYRECIIPLTKKGEVLYLMHRKAATA